MGSGPGGPVTGHRLKSYLGRIPDATHFPTHSEIEERLRRIHAEHPTTTSLTVIGASRGGKPLTMLTVAADAPPHGRRHAIVTGTPHPNEPTGTLGALALGELLAADGSLLHELGMTWHLVACVDPDGAELNYGWYAGPFTRRHYAEHIYRPPFPEQYEWTFHRSDLDPPGLAPLPESAAVAAVIDDVRPELLITMHNGEAGGLFAYATHDMPGLADGLQHTGDVTGLPLYLGPPEDQEPVLGPGLFQIAEHAGDMLSSTGYARPHGTIGLVLEPPLWSDTDVADDSPSGLTHRQVHQQAAAMRDELAARMTDWVSTIRRHLDLDASSRGRAVAEQHRHLTRAPHPDGADAELDEACTVAEARSVAEELLLERLRCSGHVVTYLREEATGKSLGSELQRVHDQASQALATWAAEQEEPAFVGLGPAVRAHVGMALTVAALLSSAPDRHE
jgi:hypothetical protein